MLYLSDKSMAVIYQAPHDTKKKESAPKVAPDQPFASPPPQAPPQKPEKDEDDEVLKPKHSIFNTLGAYQVRPRRVHFATQKRNEQIVLFLRQHPITQFLWVFFAFILIIIPPIAWPFLGLLFPVELPPAYGIIFILFWYLMLFAYIFVNFILWYYNVNIVTNQRIVDIDFVYLLAQEVSATRISQVEDVTYRKIGFFPSLFDYGNVYVSTAGPESNIEFLRVPEPKQITQTLINLMGKAQS
jgi:membrane protein YdbS with pleckstrin-like domain